MPPGNEHEIMNAKQWNSRVLILKKNKILITPATRRWKITTPQINDFFLYYLN